MPAQISHILFAEDSLRASLGEEAERILRSRGAVFRFAAQGPDFFYHNQRTRPSGLKFGIAVHREGFGRVVAQMVAEARHLREQSDGAALDSLEAYILGFTTHAVLDRKTHPFVNYFSGWTDARPDSHRYYRCHAFLERILDVLLLRHRRGTDIADYSVLPLVSCGERLPYTVVKALVKALQASYPRMHYKSLDRRRIDNAYTDTISFYTFSDPQAPEEYRRIAYLRDTTDDHRRRLALFHPRSIPADVDFLNLQGREWCHPCSDRIRSQASFLELYEQALERAVPMLRSLAEILRRGGAADSPSADSPSVESLVGNESLGSGFDATDPCTLRYSDPLPLPELIDELYRQREQAASSRSA